ncbi:hypothetical protein ACRALDRAFT_1068365 [Sodiomyces alcalophilus JCM 7366]|uniref:uncharacterized protein n=1 Tax=Sodiomyces alcalophilus JCM 7366 TaxID=591952 RepID=UPI0039B57DAB
MRPSSMTFGLPVLLVAFTVPAWAHGSVLEARAAQAVQACNPPTTRGEPFDKLSSCGKAMVTEEVICRPENGSPAALLKHASCMCKGDFFENKLACERCIRDHGGMTERDYNFYRGILDRSRNDLCGAEIPAAPFATIWSVHRDVATMPTSGATVLADKPAAATDEAATQTEVQKLAQSSASLPIKTAEPLTTATGTKTADKTHHVTATATIRTLQSLTRGTLKHHKTGGYNLTTGHRPDKRPHETGRPRVGGPGKDTPGAGMQMGVATSLLTGMAGMAAVVALFL